MNVQLTKIPVTIITGFLGAGKTTLLRHLIEHANGRRIAIVVNEFGAVGVDGDTLRSCGVTGCAESGVIELTNGCLCCTVADDFIPTMQNLLDRDNPPEHVVIETSGLALPKPLLKAFNWPSIRTRMTVDGVITVVDVPAVAEGRFADDPQAVAAQRAEDPSLDHDNPLAEVFEDQLDSADLVILNKSDLVSSSQLRAVIAQLDARARRVGVVVARHGRVDPTVVLGIAAAAEDDLASRPSHHDEAEAHEHDDFVSFVMDLPLQDSVEAFIAKAERAASGQNILRMKGYAHIQNRDLPLGIQAVGQRIQHGFASMALRSAQDRSGAAGKIVVIAQKGLDEDAVRRAFMG